MQYVREKSIIEHENYPTSVGSNCITEYLMLFVFGRLGWELRREFTVNEMVAKLWIYGR
jgi:hypothetical protein